MNRNKNKIIQSLWIKGELSNNEILCLNSYLYHGHEFHLYTYENFITVPTGILLKDANEIIPEKNIFSDDANTYCSFADWFRLKMLFLIGGWWVDMDTVCLRPFDIEKDYCFSSELNYTKISKEINNTYIKAPIDSPYISSILARMEKDIHSGNTIKWGKIGVYLWREIFLDIPQLEDYIAEPHIFCPINYFELSTLICRSSISLTENSMAVHLWNEIWRRGNLDKNAEYHPESIYEHLKRKYL